MSDLLILLTILATVLIGAISPGPSFIFVSKTTLNQSRKAGVAAALAMGTGSAIFSVLALLGLQAVLLRMPTLFWVLKVLGGVYLLYLALTLWREARKPLALGRGEVENASLKKTYFMALLTQLSNPKTLFYYGSVIAALLPPEVSGLLLYVLPVAIFLVETLWYTVVSYALASVPSQRLYQHAKTGIDRIASLALGLLGTRLLYKANEHMSV